MRNKENLNRWQREYYQNKKNNFDYMERKREAAKRYYQKHKEQCKAKNREYAKRNAENYRKYRRDWRVKNPLGIYNTIKEGAIRRGILFEISKEDFVEWWEKSPKRCYYCQINENELYKEKHIQNKRSRRLTLDRINNKEGYNLDNIVLACYMCNCIKGNYFSGEEMLKIGSIINAKRKRITN